MDLSLSEEQIMLRDLLVRYLRDNPDSVTAQHGSAGDRPSRWKTFANDLGILGVAFPETVGGLGGDSVDTMIIMEELGAALVNEPYLETVVVGGAVLRQTPGPIADRLLTQIAAGEIKIALAHAEATARYALNDVRTGAIRKGEGWLLNGEKSVVMAAPLADHLLVSARTSGDARDCSGVSLFLVAPTAAGLTRRDYRLIDEHAAADIELRDVLVAADQLLGAEGGALPVIRQATEAGIAALCAEAVGIMRRMLADTLAYTKERQQFGQPLSRFQVLQHRMVDMFIAIEQAVAATYLVTLKLEGSDIDRAEAAHAAKATIAESIRFVAQAAVQLHGAMGMTDELAVGHFFRRATAIEQQFGPVDHHLNGYAAIMRTRAAQAA